MPHGVDRLSFVRQRSTTDTMPIPFPEHEKTNTLLED